ncbi:glycolate oxidase iron-sulfur subunit [Pseudonocardia sulfidoxydans NBRC 16205]|uniref:Glycolate oxidase iron-sulfur subunit n=1 Tax=Pseudonocardia sulfidoxydans NBRC 16205 TaxID=1223511 RepID=A0A511DQI2_9PSEU|nr:heterodisulfide reductase-related iron-sulfur binding cluster [Pseudonocardia sulfidoxydans]GEL26004.1 glycolate oxidase iron-sulfur subunit [Pseudonocardia sulfidoxydans NBRC 16205]
MSTSYDAHHPPRRDVLDECVHCGFCLPTCPTYAVTGLETESPRGRIYMMDLAARGEIGVDEAFGEHIDSCLGCLACVTACPSGVQYDKLIESVRPQVERNVPRTRADTLFRGLVFALFPHPGRLRVAALGGIVYQRTGLRALVHRLGLIDRLPARLRALESLLPPVTVRALFTRTPERTRPSGPVRLRVGLLAGCAQRVFFGDVNAATVRVLAAEGCDVLVPRDRQCCGALSVHAGREEEGLARARATIEMFERYRLDVVVANVAGCGSTLKEYADLLADDPAWAERAKAFSAKVRDISELLAELTPRAPRHPISTRVAYHDACHLSNAQKIRSQPRAVLRSIPDLQLHDIAEAELCCGSAGIYNLVEPETAEELGRRKAKHLEAVTPDVVVTANAGCLLQIRRFLDTGIPLLHPVQLVDASIRGVDPL